MNFIARFSFFLFLIASFSACGRSLNVKENQTRDQAKKLILGSFPKYVNLKFYAFENKSTNFPDEDYLSVAIPEMLLSYLKPLESESVEIPLESLTMSVPEGLEEKILQLSNLYSAYLTNVNAWVTQYQSIQETNQLWKTAMDHENYRTIRKDTLLSNIWQVFLTNQEGESSGTNLLFQVSKTRMEQTNIFWISAKQTNKVTLMTTQTNGTNVSFAEKLILNEEGYFSLLTNEFQDVLSNLTRIPLRIQNEIRSGTLPTNQEPNTIYIGGSFEVEERAWEPAKIRINMKMIEVGLFTNVLNESLESREDQISERVYDLIGPLRRFVLKKTGGDIFVSTKPDQVSVYLDGVFIGKTPVHYPYVLAGTHQILLRRFGFGERYLRVEIEADKTNWVDLKLNSLNTGGFVKLTSKPTNSLVFLDSHFKGKTPMILSNLILNQRHRLILRPGVSNLKPAYFSFVLSNRSQTLSFSPRLKAYEGLLLEEQRIRWVAAYSGWGLSLGLLAYSIYQHYQREFFLDHYYTGDNEDYKTLADNADLLSRYFFNYFIVGAFVSSGLTKWALDSEQIYIGWNPSHEKIEAQLAFRF